MKVKKRILVFAVILGLLSVAMLYTYIQNLDKGGVVTQADVRNVVVAANTIPAHTKITPEMLLIKSISTDAVHPDAFISVDAAVGGTTRSELISGEQVLTGRVITDKITSPLAYRIPENMRAITVPLTEISGVAGYIMPGDKIDIMVSYDNPIISPQKVTTTQYQNIEVLEKGPYVTNLEEKQVGVTTSITVLVSPGQAEILAYATINGAFHFTLRNPVDTTKVELVNSDATNFNTWKDR